MLPSYEIFNHTIYTYGTLWVIGFIVALVFGFFYNRSGVVGKISNLDYIVLSAIFIITIIYGSRIMGFIVNLFESGQEIGVIINNPMQQIDNYYGRNMFYGGAIAVILAILIYCKLFKVSYKTVFGVFMPGASLFVMFMRLGCFGAGCCYGVPFAFGSVFTHPNSVAPLGITLFPTQLTESIFGLVMFFVLIAFGKKYGEQEAHLSMPILVFAYCVLRFFVEFMRGDVNRNILYLSVSQWIALAIAIALGIYLINYIRAKKRMQQTNNN